MITTSIPAAELQTGDIIDASTAQFGGGPEVQIERVDVVEDQVYVSVVGHLGMYCWSVNSLVTVHEFVGDRLYR